MSQDGDEDDLFGVESDSGSEETPAPSERPRARKTVAGKRLGLKRTMTPTSGSEDESSGGEGGQSDDDRPAKKSRFIDDEASVEDDEEGDDDDENADGDNSPEPGFVEEEDAEGDDSGIYRRAMVQSALAEDTAGLERIERYQRQSTEGVGEGVLVDEIERQGRLPTVRDPKLFKVPCAIGREREAVLAVMNKALVMAEKGTPLPILSCVAKDDVKSAIYVEAHRDTQVRNSLRGLRMVKWFQVKLVPLDEMPGVLMAQTDITPLRRNQWVRLRTGLYKQDLGQVIEPDHGRNQVLVKVIPRVDLKRRDTDPSDPFRRTKKRPPARLLVMNEVKALIQQGYNITSERRRDDNLREWFDLVNGQRYSNGFLYKAFNKMSVQSANINPTLEEIALFQQGAPKRSGDAEGLTERAAITQVAASMDFDRAPPKFLSKDRVKVIQGELTGLKGKVVGVHGKEVSIMPEHDQLNDVLTFQASQLSKHFEAGDRVKVVTGEHSGLVGMVVRCDGDTAILFCFSTKKEFETLVDDLELTTEMAPTQEALGNYALGDLVQLSTDIHVVGVIVKIENKQFLILDQNNEVRVVKLQEIRKKLISRNRVAIDTRSNQIAPNDQVRFIEGPHRDRRGTIKHLWRSFAFVKVDGLWDHCGMVSAKASSLYGLVSNSVDKIPMLTHSPSQHTTPSSVDTASPLGRGRGRGLLRSGRGRGMDDIIGKTIRITRGGYKGFTGVVKQATDTIVRVELHSKMKVVTANRTQIQRVEDRVGAAQPLGPPPSGMRTPRTHTPMWDARTPVDGSRTPMYDGSRTPMYDPTRTPMYDPSRTPMYDGSRTPMYDGSRTPMYDGSRTPMYEATRTPMHDGGIPDDEATRDEDSRAPATPGGYSAAFSSALPQTPGTPGLSGLPSTPGLPATPAAPQTPGVATPALPSDSTEADEAPPSGMPATPAYPGYPRTPANLPATPGVEGGIPATPSLPGDLHGPKTPAVYDPSTPATPGFDMGPPPTPSTAGMVPHTPAPEGGYPQTPAPGGRLPATPAPAATPAAPEGTESERSLWCVVGAYVLVDNADVGIIRQAHGDELYSVEMQKGGTSEIPSHRLNPKPPAPKSRCLIFGGKLRGQVGEVISVNEKDQDAVLSIGNDMQFVTLANMTTVTDELFRSLRR